MSKIEHITALEVLDSRGEPTVEGKVMCAGGAIGSAIVPSGASRGKYEALEIRDGDEKRYLGKGVKKAVQTIKTEIHAALLGMDTANQRKIDRRLIELDGTPDKSRLGANSILAVSLACARAEATSQGLPLYLYLRQLVPESKSLLPVPHMNLINGGKHSSSLLAVQEFHVIPIGAPSFAHALRIGSEIHHELGALLTQAGYQTEKGDEGGYGPRLQKSEAVFTMLVRAVESAGYVPGVDVFFGIDVAASEMYDAESGLYDIDGNKIGARDLAYTFKTWSERYPIVSIEDPFDQDAWSAWTEFTGRNGKRMQVVGDDLYATNPTRIQEGILQNASNAVLIKPNQIGTLSETLQAILIAQKASMNVIVSHRSGETEDTFIADLAVATGAGQIKTGSPVRSERTAKYNRLLNIEEEGNLSMSHSIEPFLAHQQQIFENAHKAEISR